MMEVIKQGDLVWIDLSGAQYSEQGKFRIALVLQNNIGNKFSSTTIIAPLTSELKKLNMPTHTVLSKEDNPCLKNDSMVLCEQVRTVDKKRISSVIGNVGYENMQKVKAAYMANFGL